MSKHPTPNENHPQPNRQQLHQPIETIPHTPPQLPPTLPTISDINNQLLHTTPGRPSCQPSPVPPTAASNTNNPTDFVQSQPSCQPPTLPVITTPNDLQHQQPLYDPTSDRSDHLQIHAITDDHRTANSIEHQNTVCPSNEPETTRNEKVYRSIPYIPALSQRITKILTKDYPNISITTRQHRTINQLHTKVKYPVRKTEINNVIYKIPCNDCESCYIGMTKNNLGKRLTGHKSNVNKLDKLMNDSQTNTEAAKTTLIETTTALIQHCIEHNHRFNLDQTQIIDHSYKQTTLPFLEMCHITNTDKTVNKRTDVDRLSTTYAAVLHSIKTIQERNKPNVERQTDDET
ncbi:uncharacterized protein LOC134291229 [Aedes albopictus]|uniref:GIY-YIG domain-containing protein n=1 Tax=Aedes albopictus TaxID=7160 RepID=A0ABM1YYU0_AEDAL